MICVDNKLFLQAEKLFVQSIVHEYIALYKIVNKYDLDINFHFMETFMGKIHDFQKDKTKNEFFSQKNVGKILDQAVLKSATTRYFGQLGVWKEPPFFS